MKSQILAVLIIGLFLSFPTGVFAHVVVKPNTVGVGAFTDFTLGVPSEKDLATIGVKILIPQGINSVSPIVKPGWRVEVRNSTQQGQPESIVWTGGSVPAHQKDFFMFSTQVPASQTELDWKVEQTYADGSKVLWTLGPNDPQPKDSAGKTDFSNFGPYSKTMVVNDLKADSNPEISQGGSQTLVSSSSNNLPMTFSIIALALSALAIGMQLRSRK